MTLEELQQEWRVVKIEPFSHDELRRMMYASPARRLMKVRRGEALDLVDVKEAANNNQGGEGTLEELRDDGEMSGAV